MSSMAKTAREAMKAKAQRLGSSRPLEKVDSSTFVPPELLNADVKTGLRPVSRRAFKKGGKVMGDCNAPRGDRKPRKSGGKTEATEYANAKVNRNVKAANEERPGIKHVGGMARGGRKKMTSYEARQFFDRMYEQGDRDRQAKSVAALRTPEGEAGRQARNAAVAQAFRNKSDIDSSAMKKGGRAKKNNGGGNMPLPVPRPKNLDAAPAKPVDKKIVEPGDAASRDLNRMMEIQRREDAAAPRKSGGRAKKNDGGPMSGAQEMMSRAQKTAGVPSDVISSVPTSSRFSQSMGMKKGGKAHEDVAKDKKLIKKMVKPSARTGKAIGGIMGEMFSPALMLANAIRGKKSGGRTSHEDVAEDKTLIKKMVKPSARTGRATGGQVFSGPSYPGKIPGVVTGGRTARATGGKARSKGKTNINIVIAAGKTPGADAGVLPLGGMPKPQGGIPIPLGPQGGPPQGGAPMPMPVPMPMPAPAAGPAGGPPMARKAGGRISKVASSYKDMEAGSAGGEGRLQKTDIAKKHKGAPTFKKGGKVYRSYKDMDAGSASGLGRLEKSEIAARKG